MQSLSACSTWPRPTLVKFALPRRKVLVQLPSTTASMPIPLRFWRATTPRPKHGRPPRLTLDCAASSFLGLSPRSESSMYLTAASNQPRQSCATNEHERLLLDSPLDFPGVFNAWVNRPPRRRSVACVRTHTLAILACVARLAQVQGPRFPLSQRAYVTPTQPERLRPYTAAKTRFLRHATTITPARTLGLRCRIMVCHNRNWALNPPPTLLRVTELAPCHKFVSQARVPLNALH